MLLNDFYTILKTETTENTIQALIHINKSHPIFKGHFPAQPVVPGVCMMQIVKELTDRALNQTHRIQSGDNMKFLSVIDPEKNDEIHVSITHSVSSDNLRVINASMFFGEVTFFKLKATLRPQ